MIRTVQDWIRAREIREAQALLLEGKLNEARAVVGLPPIPASLLPDPETVRRTREEIASGIGVPIRPRPPPTPTPRPVGPTPKPTIYRDVAPRLLAVLLGVLALVFGLGVLAGWQLSR